MILSFYTANYGNSSTYYLLKHALPWSPSTGEASTVVQAAEPAILDVRRRRLRVARELAAAKAAHTDRRVPRESPALGVHVRVRAALGGHLLEAAVARKVPVCKWMRAMHVRRVREPDDSHEEIAMRKEP